MKLWNEVPIPVRDPATDYRAGGALAYFYVGGTSTPQPVFTTDDGGVPHTWPVEADANGVFPPIFIPYGPFGYRVTTAGGTAISPNVLTVQNPAPPDSGGGGGIVVQADQILTTGDTMWRLQGGTRTGWVRMNEKTVGNTGSGATERANADTESVFTYLWNNCADTVAPVSGGRGATAAADFAANKTITVPTMQGIVAGGLDDMGGTAANRLQVATTITTTNSSATATVASATGLSLGMYAIASTIPAGTTISAISGTTVTLSTGAGVTAGTGTAVRFSLFPDAQQVGSVGGQQTVTITNRELPVITPAGSVSVSINPFGGPSTNNGTGSTAAPQSNGFWTGSSGLISPTGTGSFSGTPFGQGGVLRNIQPTRLGTFYMKL